MEKYLLDTSSILNILDGNKKGEATIELIRTGELITSILCYCEALNKLDLNKLKKAEEFLSKIGLYQLTLADGFLAKEIQHTCRKNGGQVSTIDALIAATAHNNKSTLITSDSDFNRIEQVNKKIV